MKRAPPCVLAITKLEVTVPKDDYSDIIHLPRPASKHPKMPLAQRAKQFAPFAALGSLDTNHIKPKKISSTKQIIGSNEDETATF